MPNLRHSVPPAALPYRVDKPWGHELVWAHTEAYAAKILTIAPGCSLSLQYHREKVETIYVYQGRLEVSHFPDPSEERIMVERERRVLDPGDTFHVPAGTKHQFTALDEMAIVLEVSTPQLDDVVRLEDRYGRV